MDKKKGTEENVAPKTEEKPAYDPEEFAGRKAVIEFKNVNKTYKLFKNEKERFRSIFRKKTVCKTRKAINDVTFQIHDGEAVALLGRNGAGKSTLLKLITGVAYPTDGEIMVDGRVSALLELTAGFDSEFTGRENIYFRCQLLGMQNEEIEKIEPDVEEFAEIGEYMDQPVRTYSSGMKARLGFAINVNINPEILIVDEALSVGDVSFRRKCLEAVRELIDEKKVTFLLVTHSTDTAKKFCKRGIVMKQGKMIYDSDVDSAADYYNEMIKKEDAAKRKKMKKKREKELEEANRAEAERKAKKEASKKSAAAN